MHHCLNCGTDFSGKYCPNCGQKSDVGRITVKALFGEFFHLLTHIEKTFFKTTLDFIIRPGRTSLNYLEGKRQRYQRPVSYFLIWTGVFILFHNLIINWRDYELILNDTGQTSLQTQANVLLREHFEIFSLPILLASAIITWIVLARPKIYFIEVFTLVLYGGGTYFFLNLLSDVILGVILKININQYAVFLWQTLLSGFYNIWFTYDFFSRAKIKFFLPRMILAAFLISLSGKLIMDYAPMLWMYLTK